MATRSLICKTTGFETEIESKYCHWDGYPSHNGDILLNHYNDEIEINNLLANDEYISSLESTIEETKFAGEERNNFHKDEQTLIESNDYGVEYIYLFKNGEWYVTCTHLECPDVPYGKFILLSDVLKTL